MGCQVCRGNENVGNINIMPFEDTNGESISENYKTKKITNHGDYNRFIKRFEEKLPYIGTYLPIPEFDSLSSEEIRKYMIENSLDISKYIPKDQITFDVKPVVFKNGNIYQGNWNENFEMEGYGKYYLKDERVLAEGIWIKGELKYARVFLPNGDIYEGEIEKSNFNGRGKLIGVNGEIYEGDFIQGEKSGLGKIIFSDGTEYNGEVVNGVINGKGNMKWTNGIEYQGDFVNCVLEGEGNLSNMQGDNYRGHFNKNCFNGRGIYTYNNGDFYEGNFEYGIRKGKGVYSRHERFIYEGGWDNNLPSGFGKITKGNSVLKSTWRNGEIMEVPTYEKGSAEDFKDIEFNFKPEEMGLNSKYLAHLVNEEVHSSQYRPGSMPSFLEE